jgi:transaldolase
MIGNTKLFLDGGDPEETKHIQELLASKNLPGLDGQTTNPSLIAKNLAAKAAGSKLSKDASMVEYKRIVTEMSALVTGPVSIQVITEPGMTADDILAAARERLAWIPNAMIKFPCIPEGLKAASVFCHEGPVNMTLVFSQAQAAAVYSATKGATHQVVISPFVGRLDDRGEDGLDLIDHIVKMYALGDGHVATLTASIRTLDQLYETVRLGSPIMTVPGKVIEAWIAGGAITPDMSYSYPSGSLKPIDYVDLPLDQPFASYDLHHDLTDTGLTKFLSDWHTYVE